MPVTHHLVDAASMLAVRGSLIVVGFFLLGVVLAAYAIYWIVFKMGKD